MDYDRLTHDEQLAMVNGMIHQLEQQHYNTQLNREINKDNPTVKLAQEYDEPMAIQARGIANLITRRDELEAQGQDKELAALPTEPPGLDVH